MENTVYTGGTLVSEKGSSTIGLLGQTRRMSEP